MSHTQAGVAGAVNHSISHDEIVTVIVQHIPEAFAALCDECEPEDHVMTTGGYDGLPLMEVWGTTDDGEEWRVHLQQEHPLVVVEYMPMSLRAAHEAARNSGVYPHNGAHRVAVFACDAEADEWTEILDSKNPNKYPFCPDLSTL